MVITTVEKWDFTLGRTFLEGSSYIQESSISDTGTLFLRISSKETIILRTLNLREGARTLTEADQLYYKKGNGDFYIIAYQNRITNTPEQYTLEIAHSHREACRIFKIHLSNQDNTDVVIYSLT